MKNSSLLILLLLLIAQCKSVNNTAGIANLENTYWKLSEVNGMPVQTPENAKEVHMVLSNEGGQKTLKGFAGCNGLGGNYTTNGNKIDFTVITTKMYCEDRMDVENFLTKTLTDTDTYKINGEVLELYQDDTFLAKFESVYLK